MPLHPFFLVGKGSPGSALDPVVAGSVGQPVLSRSWVDLGRGDGSSGLCQCGSFDLPPALPSAAELHPSHSFLLPFPSLNAHGLTGTRMDGNRKGSGCKVDLWSQNPWSCPAPPSTKRGWKCLECSVPEPVLTQGDFCPRNAFWMGSGTEFLDKVGRTAHPRGQHLFPASSVMMSPWPPPQGWAPHGHLLGFGRGGHELCCSPAPVRTISQFLWSQWSPEQWGSGKKPRRQQLLAGMRCQAPG